MKKLFLALMAIVAIALTSCEKKSDGTSGGTSEKVETISATDITSNGALLTGQIGVEIADYKSVEYGMLISEKESDVSSYDGKKLVGDNLIGQTFSVTANGLSAETKYYYRAYLVLNAIQYEYGDTKSFKTEDALFPTVTTTEVTNVSFSSATCGGNVSDDGGATVTERGICYSASEPFPTIRNSKVSGGSGKGAFIVNLSSLKENTTYYVRAYATNAKGTSYGDVKSFKTEKQSFTPSKDVKAVDLGLSVKWANMNIGATTPEGRGAYFAWGETSPKSSYDYSTYFDTKDGGKTFIKYPSDGGKYLDLADDAAHVNWGGNWRMPTKAEQEEMRVDCTWTWTTQNGVEGYLVKSKKNSNSIFLPAAGYRDGSSLNGVGSHGIYWTSSRQALGAWNLYFYLDRYGDHVSSQLLPRYHGIPVRPVCQ